MMALWGKCELGLTVISLFASATASACRSKALRPALGSCVNGPLCALFLHETFFVPQEHCSVHCNPSSRQGQPFFFLPLPLLHVFLQLQNYKQQ
jgi:hypothetical protein